MKRMLPNRVELLILAAVALIASAVLTTSGKPEALAVVAFPLLLGSMLMGARRMGHLAPARQPVQRRVTKVDVEVD